MILDTNIYPKVLIKFLVWAMLHDENFKDFYLSCVPPIAIRCSSISNGSWQVNIYFNIPYITLEYPWRSWSSYRRLMIDKGYDIPDEPYLDLIPF